MVKPTSSMEQVDSFASQSTANTNAFDLSWLGKHVLCLTFVDSKVNRDDLNDDVKFFTFTSTLISVQGNWFAVTAKHVFDHIDQRLNSSSHPRKIVKCRIADYLHRSASHHSPLPFDWDGAPKIKIGEDSDFDVGAIWLNENTVKLLQSNGIHALDERTWRNIPTEFESYCVAGIPISYIDLKDGNPRDPDFSPQISIMTARIERKTRRPAGLDKKRTNRFWGRLPKKRIDQHGEPVDPSLEGMSGGPIFGFRKNEIGRGTYYLVAVQCAQSEDMDYVSGNYAAHIGYSLEQFYRPVCTQPTD